MRPLVLTFKGIRSYRSEQTIDLRGRTLVGVVGETGAGKSSILEALHFALFGDCTWEAPTHKVLIADGGDGTLSVSLTFSTGNRTWLVERSISRDRATSVHRLTCPDDTVVTGRRAVDKRVRDIIGMDQETFTKSVILPQGRFEQLLHMSAGERASVLKRLLGIDDLDTIREMARTRHEQLLPLLTTLTTRRDALEPDPRAAAAGAEKDLHAVQATLAQLRRIAASVTAAISERSAVAGEHDRIAEALQRLGQQVAGHDVAAVAKLAQAADQLDEDDHAIQERIDPIRREIDQLVGELGARAPGQPEADTANKALIALAKIAEQQRQITHLRGELETAASNLAEREATLATLRHAANEAAGAAETAHNISHKEAADAEAAAAVAATARTLLLEARTATKELSAVTRRAEEVDRRGQAAAETLIRTQAEFDDLDGQLAAALERQTELQRLNSAAHAAEGLNPGDTCPICSHAIAADFHPPVAATLTTINKTVKTLQKNHGAAAQVLSDVKAEKDHIAKQRPALDQELDKAARTLATTVAAAAEVIGTFTLDAEDSVILASTASSAAQAQERAATAAREDSRLAAEAAAAQATADAAAGELQDRTNRVASQREGIDALVVAVDGARRQLPGRYQPADATEAAIETAAQTARLDHEQQSRTVERLGVLRAEVAAADTERVNIGKRYDRMVRRPAALRRQQTQTLLYHHDVLADFLGLGHAAAGDPAAGIAEQVAWTTATAAHATELTAAAGERLHVLAQRVETLVAAIADTLATAPTEGQELSEAVEHQVGQEALAQQRYSSFLAQIPVADDLQSRIDATRPHVQSLKALVGLLSDAKFIGHVVAERQRALLANANALLSDMTRRRFAFAEDFQIFDSHTGQLRDVKTMSGGESFQASLALALALVEQTALNGGRAEALLLDEGFGTLDRSALTHALDALQSQVRAGRLVVVISHLRAVADHVSDLLLVELGPSGSTARWVGDHERADMAEEDLYGGLQE